MEKELIEMIVKPIAVILGMLITAYVIPWIKAKINSDKLSQLTSYAEIAVRAAEQVFGTEEYKLKKAYVLTYLSTKAEDIGMDISSDDIENLLESTVNYVKYGMEYNRE